MKTERKPRLVLSQPKPDLSATLDRVEALIAAQTKLVEQVTALVETLARPRAASYRLDDSYAVDGPRDWAEADREEAETQPEVYENADRPPSGHNSDANAILDELVREAQELGLYEDDPPPAPDADGMWRKRLQLYGMKLWQPEWGPMPGQEGCQVPSYLLNGRR